MCLGKNVAVKKVNANILTDPNNPDAARDVHRAVKREINVLGSFRNNPNLIRLIGYHVPTPSSKEKVGGKKAEGEGQGNGGGGGDGGDGGEDLSLLNQICLVYEYADKGDLFKLLEHEHVEWQVRLRIAVGVAKGLNYLHANKAFHRDIKGSNIVIQSIQTTPKIIDCGLSKSVPDNDSAGGAGAMSVFTTTGMKFGTLAYMCPQYTRSPTMSFDALCDIYSFGIVLLEILTGRRQATDEIYLQEEVEDIAVDPTAGEWPPECVNELRELCNDCVEKRSKRVKSMTTVMRRLTGIRQKYDIPTVMESNLSQENELLRRQVEELRIQRDVNERIRDSEEEKICAICCDRFKLSQGVECKGKNENHFICAVECLGGMVLSQSTRLQDFINNGCMIVCALCESVPIEQRISAPIDDNTVCKLVDEMTVHAFIKVQRDATTTLEQKIAEGRLARERQRAHDLFLQGTAKILTNQAEKKQKCLERHILRIREDILNTHCPHCDLVFSDWDACMAVQHSSEDIHGHQYGCMRYFCGWCMMKCKSNSQCHQHVKRCPLNKNPGSYFGREEQYKQVHATMKKDKLNNYFNIHMNPEFNNDNNNNNNNNEGLTRDDVINALKNSDLTPLGIYM